MGKEKLNITKGDRYDSVEIIEEVFSETYKRRHVKCLCECGQTFIAPFGAIKNKGTKSCGCHRIKKDLASRKIFVNKGERFGFCTVIEEIQPKLNSKNRHIRMVQCLCDCGNIFDVYINYLVKSHNISCGCSMYLPFLKAITKHGMTDTIMH